MPFDGLRVSGSENVREISRRGTALLSLSKDERVEAWGGVCQSPATAALATPVLLVL
jgi:hypothetical protein